MTFNTNLTTICTLTWQSCSIQYFRRDMEGDRGDGYEDFISQSSCHSV